MGGHGGGRLEDMQVTVFGLGEAGSSIAADLVEAGAKVHGYDPADVPTPPGVRRHQTPQPSVRGSQLVLAVTSAVDSRSALAQAAETIEPGTIYADLSTAPPGLKEELAEHATSAHLPFADVALLAPVPDHGLATPSLVSGPGARRYVAIVDDLGGQAEFLSDHPGDAAGHKLLRSVVTKGLTSLLIESLEGAEANGSTDWVWAHLVEFLGSIDEGMLNRLIGGTPRHVKRRIVEMEAAQEFLVSLGVSPTMTEATVAALRLVEADGIGGYATRGGGDG